MPKVRLNPKLLDKLAKKLGKTTKYVREQISIRALRNSVSSEAYFYDWLMREKIGAGLYYRSLSPDIKNDIHALRLSSRNPKTIIRKVSPQEIKKIENIFKIKKLTIKSKPTLLTQDIINNAGKNAEIYQCLFVFENCVRNIIISVLKKHGPDWWKAKVGRVIKEKVNERKMNEKLNPWRGSRGPEPIFYTDFLDLETILHSNSADFNPLFKGIDGGLNWLAQRLKECANIRNNIAHTIPLSKKDKDIFLLYFKNIYDQLDILNKRI